MAQKNVRRINIKKFVIIAGIIVTALLIIKPFKLIGNKFNNGGDILVSAGTSESRYSQGTTESKTYREHDKTDETTPKMEVKSTAPPSTGQLTYAKIFGNMTWGTVARNNNLYAIGKFKAAENLVDTTKTFSYVLSTKTPEISVGNGLTAGEAYILAHKRVNTSADRDKNQIAFAKLKNNLPFAKDPDSEYKGMDGEADSIVNGLYGEAKALNLYIEKLNKFKVANNGQEITDAMLPRTQIDSTGKAIKKTEDQYASGKAGVVSYDKKEILVGPFSIDYIRDILTYKDGEYGRKELMIGDEKVENITNASKMINDQSSIIYSAISDANLYGLKNGSSTPVPINDWQFVFTDVKSLSKSQRTELNNKLAIYKMPAKTEQVRTAEYDAIMNNNDVTPNYYPYPNETFYIKFKDLTIDAIKKIEFTLTTMNAKADVYVLESTGNSSLYQIKNAEIVKESKKIGLSVGNYHKATINGKNYEGYMIPLTMDFGGTVWKDGTDKQYKSNKVDGVKGDSEKGIEGVKVYLCNNSNGTRMQSTTTDANGKYSFEYAKIGTNYYIEFEYDGMTYKATKYLEDSGASIETMKSNFIKYLKASHVQEPIKSEGGLTSRTEFNNKYYEIKGSSKREESQAINIDPAKANTTISYKIDDHGDRKDDKYMGAEATANPLLFKARTSTTGLIYPLHEAYMVTNKSLVEEIDIDVSEVDTTFELGKKISGKNDYYSIISAIKQNPPAFYTQTGIKDTETPNNIVSTMEYTKIEDYIKNINLGLIEREPADFAIKNDIVETKFTLNEVVSPANISDFGKKASTKSTAFDLDVRDGSYFNAYTQNIGKAAYAWKIGDKR